MSTPNDKLIDAKQKLAQRNAEQGRGTGSAEAGRDRLPPGQKLVPTDRWPVLDLGIKPNVPLEKWKLEIFGACEKNVFSWDDFRALPQTKLVTDFHCVTTWSIYDAHVEGVLWKDLLTAIKPDPAATHVLFHSSDGYTTNMELAELNGDAQAMIVHSFDGKPLSREHGGPVRGWIPKFYAWKSAKWIKGIEFLLKDKRGFWEVRGYHNHADPWTEERYSSQEV